MTYSSIFISSLILSITLSSSLIFLTEAQKTGVSLDLIHRDSPKSPDYNPNETPYQRITKTLHRSINRVNHVNRYLTNSIGLNDAPADVYNIRGEYLMNISIGTPPFPILAIVDTGSDLIWIQCKPCNDCYEQEAPLFDPSSSSTYEDISCDEPRCGSLERPQCNSNICQYTVRYGDNSFSIGNLASDDFNLVSTTDPDRPTSFSLTKFGCGHQNGGKFDSKAAGIVGLGRGGLSLVSQWKAEFPWESDEARFSYCLIPLSASSESSSTINFGKSSLVSGLEVVSTPLVSKDPATFYFLTLEAISVGRKRLEYGGVSSQTKFGSQEGNIIIDSGTTLTMLDLDFTSRLTKEVSSQIKSEPVPDPQGILDLCYKFDPDFTAPTLIVHFKGADVKLKPVNTFIQNSAETICFAFKGTNGVAIYGNLAQVDFLVGYDIGANTVSFKPTDCTEE